MNPFKIPGTNAVVSYQLRNDGSLERLLVDRKPYVFREGDAYCFEGNWLRFTEKKMGRAFYRHVHTTQKTWLESYSWDKDGLIQMVDGTFIERDQNSYVTKCSNAEQTWHYRYENHALAEISTPSEQRLLSSKHARIEKVVDNRGSTHFHYDQHGKRLDTPPQPQDWHVDDWGRLWTITDASGAVVTTYLWWGFACLARLDGPPGTSITALFSLDPTGTPVRATTAQSSVRFFRDAFGESLLGTQGVPGLFGGGIHQQFIHYRGRVLDPLCGSFTATDPFHGGPDDPRRIKGYQGSLPVEKPAAGPYCVCQNDPFSRMDPTGEISAGFGTFLTTLSTLTWGFQNNIVGINLLGFWNIMLSLLSFNGKVIKRIGDVEAMRSPYTGAWGFRCHPSGLELLGINRHRAWTVQHIIWARGEEFEELDKARVFVPNSAFEPSLLGSVLWVQPAHGKKKTDPGFGFLLSGTRRDTIRSAGVLMPVPNAQTYGYANGWTRSGGIGKPVFEKSTTPYFPEGGLHFGYQRHVPSPVSGTIAEIFPTGDTYQGEMNVRFTLMASDLKKTPAKGQVVMVKAEDDIELFTIRGNFKHGDARVLVTEEVPNTLAHYEAKLFEMDLDANNETLPQGSALTRIDAQAPASTISYRKDDYLRLEHKATNAIAGAQITDLEAVITLDNNSPATIGTAPFTLYQPKKLVHQGQGEVDNKNLVKFTPGDPMPDVGDMVVLESGADQEIVLVSALLGNDGIVPTHDISATMVTAKTVKWYKVRSEKALGEWNGTAGIDITYTPEKSGKAPDSGPIIIRNKGDDLLGVRNCVGRKSDELIISKDLPGGLNPHELVKIKKGDTLDNEVFTKDYTVLVPSSAGSALRDLPKSNVMQLIPINGPTIVSGTANPAIAAGITVFQNRTWVGNQLHIPNYGAAFVNAVATTHTPMPGQLVVLQEHGTTNHELAVVKKLTKTVTLTHEPAFKTGFAVPANDWELTPLEEEGLYFKAIRKAPKKVVLQAEAYRMSALHTFDASPPGIGTEKVWMPRFREGDILRAIWDTGGGPVLGLFRVVKQAGAYLELDGSQNIPASPTHLAFCKMIASSPNNASHRAGVKGKRNTITTPGAPPVTTYNYDFSVHTPNGILNGSYALINGTDVWPVEVNSQDELLIDFYSPPGIAGSNADVILPQTADVSLYSASHHIVEDEWFFTESHLQPSTNSILIKPYQDPAVADLKNGKITPGTVGVPDDDSDTFELDRRQALETHELQHTVQFLSQGPTVLTMIPLFLFDIIAKAGGEGLETAEYSEFVQGSITTTGSVRRLTIPQPGDIDFAPGRSVQVVQNANVHTVELSDLENGQFRIIGAETISDGQVSLRLRRKEATEKLAKAYRWLELFSTGGAQNAVIGPLVNLLPFAVANIVHACKGDPGGRFLQPTLFPATVPDPANPFVIEVGQLDGDDHPFEVHDLLELVVNGNRDQRLVVAVNGNQVSLNEVAIFSDEDQSLQVGKIGEEHPMKSVSDTVSNTFGTTDLRWFFDPLGQLFYEADENDGGSLDWALTFLRPFYSTTSWSGIGIFGGFWLDIVWTTVFGEDYYSFMEQGASEMSGDLYSPVGRKRGDLEYVGDLGRYFYYHDRRNGTATSHSATFINDEQIRLDDPGPGNAYRINSVGYEIGDEVTLWWTTGGGDSDSKFFEITAIERSFTTAPPSIVLTLKTIPGLDSLGKIPAGMVSYSLVSSHIRNFNRTHLIHENQGDAPGVNTLDFLRVMPHRSAPGNPPGVEPNLAAASPNPSSQAIPHDLFVKSNRHPLAPSAGSPDSYHPSVIGSVPASPQLQRSRGMYAAFSQPSGDPHRLTMRNHFSVLAGAGREAMNVCGTTRQQYIFDQQVKDVEIFHAGTKLAATLELVYCQKATFRVEPDKNRTYGVTVLDPQHDEIARNTAAMTVLAQKKKGSTHVEISREYDGQSPATHLNLGFSVPVRSIEITVDETLPLREKAEMDAALVTRDANPGDTFYLFVPAKITTPVLKKNETRTYSTAPPKGHIDPEPGRAPQSKKDLDDDVADFIGSGRVYEIRFDEDDPPEESMTFEWVIPVEAGQAHAPKKLTADLKAAIDLKAFFRLESDPLPGKFSMPEPAGNKLILKTDPNTIEISDDIEVRTADPAITNPNERFQFTVKDGGKTLEIETVDSTAPGFYQIVVTNDDNSDQKAVRTIEIL